MIQTETENVKRMKVDVPVVKTKKTSLETRGILTELTQQQNSEESTVEEDEIARSMKSRYGEHVAGNVSER